MKVNEKMESAIAAIIKVMKLNILGKVNKIIIPIKPVKINTKLVIENSILIFLFPIKVKINTNKIKISIRTFNTTY